MLKALVARFREGCRTGAFPPSPPNLPPDFKGRPEISADTTAEDVDAMKAVCPVDDALSFNDGRDVFSAADARRLAAKCALPGSTV